MGCMAKPMQLEAEDRALFSQVARIVFTNPFSDERAQLDAEIAGGTEGKASSRDHMTRGVERVSARLARLEEAGGARLHLYRAEDRDNLAYTFLFDTYHRFRDAFDELIAEQLRSGDESVSVPFATEALGVLERRGFSSEEALRDFGLFYQLRRAFYFIDRALVGESRSMKELRLSLWNNIFTSDIRWYNIYLWNRMEDFSTLLLGETGTGKGSAAGAIGKSGFIPFDAKRNCFAESFTRTFVSLNLSQFPEALIESELFGHRKGAFTGAVEDHHGVFSACSPHGSIFLDEIGDVAVPVQIKLLQVLQDRIFSPVGSHEKKRFRGRVIAATNRSIEELRGEGLFRDDFFYRLCSDLIIVPPLRQRIAEEPGELEGLVKHVLRRMLGEEAPALLDLVMETISKRLGKGYPWPGNVRELEQCVRRILLKRSYEGDREALSTDLRGDLFHGIDTEALDASLLLQGYCTLLYERHGSYEKVSRLTNLDRRTVKKYVGKWRDRGDSEDDEAASGDASE